jgi:F420-non-reducing hydrogenase large subunit
VDLIKSDPFVHKTYNMGTVDANNHVNFYDGKIRVVGPDGREHAKYDAKDYRDYIVEHVEPWTYLKFPYLKNIGWKGFRTGKDVGVYRVAPLARLNVARGFRTPLAHAGYEKFFATLGGKPCHATLANHWARVIELMYAVERVRELIHDEETCSPNVRTLPTAAPTEGVGVIEAPRGTLFHHYQTDEQGLVTRCNMLVATGNNNAAICMSVRDAARGLIKAGQPVTEGLLNMVEMAFRAYDPCFGCATHSLPGKMPLTVTLRGAGGAVLHERSR